MSSSKNILVWLIPILFFQSIDGLLAQDTKEDRRSITIVYPDSTVKAYMLTSMPKIKIKNDLMYYWVYHEMIYWNRGDYAYYLLDGEYRVFDKSNKLLTKGTFREGVKDGEWKRWHINGELSSRGIWKAGQRQGRWFFFDSNGERTVQLTYKDDLLHGKCLYFNSGERRVKRFSSGKERQGLFSKKKSLNENLEDDPPVDE